MKVLFYNRVTKKNISLLLMQLVFLNFAQTIGQRFQQIFQLVQIETVNF